VTTSRSSQGESELLVSVFEAGSRRPLDGVAVWIASSGNRGTTSTAGEARLKLPDSDGPFEVVAKTKLGAWAHATVARSEESIILEVPQDLRLGGIIHWADGSVASDLPLKILGTGTERKGDDGDLTPAWSDRQVALDVTTDSEGHFEVLGLAEEVRVGVRSRDQKFMLLSSGLPDPSGTIWTTLPATDLHLIAVAGLRTSVDFVDDRTGGPVAGLETELDWPPGLTDYAKAQSLNRSKARLDFLWPLERGALTPMLTGHATARGFVPRNFELRGRPETGETVVRLVPDSSGRLTVLHPWGSAISMRKPQFSALCDDRAVNVDAVGRNVMPIAEESGKWVFAGLPSGRCVISCHGVEIASKDLAPGEEATVQADLGRFSRIVLRPRRDGKQLTGVVKLLTRGVGSLQARELELPESGTIDLFPIPVGVLRVSIARSTEVSSPETISIEVPGRAETVEMDVQMVPR